MPALSTAIYTVTSEEEAEQFAVMAPTMAEAYVRQPGFRRLIVARDVSDPLIVAVLSWWDSPEAAKAWAKSQEYRTTKDDAGGRGIRAGMEFGRWVTAK